MSTANADVGLIGLAVMGENLVLNMESRGYTVAVFNRTRARVDDFLAGRARGYRIVGLHTDNEMEAAL
jgi:6-phosphogluconate dehydrogenase